MKKLLISLLLASITSIVFAQQDVTIETYGIVGKGRPTTESKYYFLQDAGNGIAKIQTRTQNSSAVQINVERSGNFVYFSLANGKYLKYNPANRGQVKWLPGKDENAKWKEIAPIQPGANGKWKSYVLASNTSLYLRHQGFVMYAHTKVNNNVFYGDATWRIAGGCTIPPVNTPNREAYGEKTMQTYAVVNNATNNFFVGVRADRRLGIIDKTKSNTGRILDLEILYKSHLKAAVLIEKSTGKYVTASSNGTITLTMNETKGSLWKVSTAKQPGLDKAWKSFESVLKPGHFLRHQGFVLYAHTPNNGAKYFKKDASWKMIKK